MLLIVKDEYKMREGGFYSDKIGHMDAPLAVTQMPAAYDPKS